MKGEKSMGQDILHRLNTHTKQVQKQVPKNRVKSISTDRELLLDDILSLIQSKPKYHHHLNPPSDLPFQAGIFTVHSLGTILPLPNYHCQYAIWPPGYKISRPYYSMINPLKETSYTCTIQQGPIFEVVADDCPHKPMIANSASDVWRIVIQYSHFIRNLPVPDQVCGSRYYGLMHPTIVTLVQGLPHADECTLYQWQSISKLKA